MPRRPKSKPSYRQHATEAEFQDTVTEMADRLGWRWHHETDSRRSEAGFPDLVLVHPNHGVLWLELKTAKGRVRAEQHNWIYALQQAGQRAFVVRPADLDAIELALRGELW